MSEVIPMAHEEGVKRLCFTHLQREVRKNKAVEIENLIQIRIRSNDS